MDVLDPALEFFLFFAVDNRNTNTNIHPDALIRLRVKKHQVISPNILVSSFLFQELAWKDANVDVWAS